MNLLYQKQISVPDTKINIIIPTVGEILEDEEKYFSHLTMLTSTPVDFMVYLDNIGIDFTDLNDYDLFLLLFNELKSEDTSLIFGDLDLSKFSKFTNNQNGNIVLYDKENDIAIDRAVHGRIAAILRKIHHLERNTRKPANKEAKDYMIERARKKMRRNLSQTNKDSQIESLIISLVNTEQYKYDFESTKELSIYQFNECVRQINKKVDYDNRMGGVYAGTIGIKELKQEDLTWFKI